MKKTESRVSMKDVLEIKPDIYWIGALHPELRVFDELFPTKYGTTYNSYLVRGEKVAIVDTVKERFRESFLDKVRQLVDPARIDYVVINHTEPDHSGALKALLRHCPEATVVSSPTAAGFLRNQLDIPFKGHAVKDGEVLDLGGKRLRFFHAPFLHWPDTMFTLQEEAGVLFTCDAFGAHYCGSGMFNDEAPDLVPEMEFYFECLIRPFKDRVMSAIDKIRNERIEVICPSHGPVLRADPMKAVALYERWSREATAMESSAAAAKAKIVIFYLSPHGNTARMAEAVAAGAEAEGVEVVRCRIDELTEARTRDLMEQAEALIFGVPTVNRDAPRPMWDILAQLSSVKLRTSIAGVFGSYGWSGEACKMVEERLKGLRFRLPADFVRVPFTPKADALAHCGELGKAVAEEVLRQRRPPGGDPAAR
jgi:flavorubredoxin